MTDIREQAAKAAREWVSHGAIAANDSWEASYFAGYLAGYEAAKAEAAANLAEIRERLEMARKCLEDGDHWRGEQSENQAMRHIDSALEMFNDELADGEAKGKGKKNA